MSKKDETSDQEDLDQKDYKVEEDEERIIVEYRDSSGKIQKRSIKKDKVKRPKKRKKDGCFITTACVKSTNLSDNCIGLKAFRKLKDDYLAKSPEGRKLIDLYYSLSQDIIKNIYSREISPEKIFKKVYYHRITPITQEIQAQNYNLAISIAISMVKELYEKYCS